MGLNPTELGLIDLIYEVLKVQKGILFYFLDPDFGNKIFEKTILQVVWG